MTVVPTPPSGTKPLAGIRVLECASVIAGPYAGFTLAMLGAEVIKVERPGEGDWMRSQGGNAANMAALLGGAFLSCNAAKQSVTLNLKDPRGVRIARALAATCDVMIENWRPGTAARLGIGFDDIKAVKPDIVYCSISGFGQDGPMAPRPAYDHIVQAVSGIMAITGTAETAPSRTGPPLVDYLTGISAALGVVAALRERDRTGAAQLVDVGMLDCAVAAMGSVISAHFNGGLTAAPIGNAAASGAPSSGLFATSTSKLTVVANTEAQFRALCQAIGRADLLEDPRFADPPVRVQNQEALRALLAETFATRPALVWEAALAARGVPVGAVRGVADLPDDPQVRARGLFRSFDLPDDGGAVMLPAGGFKLNGARVAPDSPPPRLGADNQMLLSALGYDAASQAALREAGIL